MPIKKNSESNKESLQAGLNILKNRGRQTNIGREHNYYLNVISADHENQWPEGLYLQGPRPKLSRLPVEGDRVDMEAFNLKRRSDSGRSLCRRLGP